jgi:hypothetical protein
MITQARLRELLTYENGKLLRKNGVVAGSVNKRGYRVICVDYKLHKAHRLVFLYHHGYLPAQVDHINGDKDDNRIENLRAADNSKNMMNRKSMRNNTSGHKNVYWDKESEKWAVKVRLNRKLHNMGRFENIEDAVTAAYVAREKLHGEYANHGV